MKLFVFLVASLLVCLIVAVAEAEKTDAELIANAESAAPATVTKNATIKTMEGKVLRQGSNGWTCYPGTKVIGPMCNRPQWDQLLHAMMNKQPIDVKEFSISYMLAGEGEALGVSLHFLLRS